MIEPVVDIRENGDFHGGGDGIVSDLRTLRSPLAITNLAFLGNELCFVEQNGFSDVFVLKDVGNNHQWVTGLGEPFGA